MRSDLLINYENQITNKSIEKSNLNSNHARNSLTEAFFDSLQSEQHKSL